MEVLDAIIEEDEANSSARKRKIAIFKAQGDRARTVAELNKYLKVFMSDQVTFLWRKKILTGKKNYFSRKHGWSCVICTSWTRITPRQPFVVKRYGWFDGRLKISSDLIV